MDRGANVVTDRKLRIATLLLTILLACAAALGLAGRAGAYTGLNTFTMVPSTTQAGGHPNVDLEINFNNRMIQNNQNGNPSPSDSCNCEDVARIDVHFPTGFIGNPHAIGLCTLDEMSNYSCPSDSQVGIVEVTIIGITFGQSPLYNLEPHPEEPGLLAFNIPFLDVPSFIVMHGRTGSDYGLDSSTIGIVHTLPVNSLKVHLWGVPGDPSHNINRLPSPQQGCGAKYPEPCPGTPTPFNGTPAPYLENPTSCGTALSASVDLGYYDGTTVHGETPYPSTTDCDLLSFDPSLAAAPTTRDADTASGLDIDLKVPQAQSPTVPSPSEIKSATITLPRGFSVNPNAADGKTACSDAEASFGTEFEAHCPETAKVGTISIDSSALPGPISGGMYLGQPLPGNRYRLFMTADGFSTHVKLAGVVHLDRQTGQAVVVFDDLPQSPLQEFDVHLFGSERGLLATPAKCGEYEISGEFVPWDSALATQRSVSHFTIDSGPGGRSCPGAARPFAPSFLAGGPDNTAGAYDPISVRVGRNDGDQNVTGIQVKAPPGVLASLRGIPYCPQAALDRLADQSYSGLVELLMPACPAVSRIGTVSAGVGAGSRPLHTPGSVYLAGPYKGAPISFVVVVPAVSGPYDLGNIAVRVAVNVDPASAEVTTVSDPLPQVIEGILLRARSIQVDLDRPNFTINPTNCGPFTIAGTILGDEGGMAMPSVDFQVANCAGLPYSPEFSLKLSGGVNRLGHPAIHAVFKTKAGEANSRSVSVMLPRGEQLDNGHIRNICTRVQFAAASCPPSSVIGEATVTTPLLDQPLTGKIYLRSSSHTLPDLAVDLSGQLSFELVGRVDSPLGRLRTTFESLPDTPVSSVVIDLAGGSKGLLINSNNLCGSRKRATARMTGQNGDTVTRRPRLEVACGGKGRHARHHRGRHH